MFLPKPGEGGTYEPCPPGTYTAICYRFLDRGTQATEFNGEKKRRHEVMLTWEIPDETMTDGRPFSISKTYTFSMHEKAALRQHLEAWRGKMFSDEDFEGPNAFNTRNLLGKACTLTVVQETNPKGDVYSKVASVGKAMKGIQIPEIQNPLSYLALDKEGWDASVYGTLSDKIRELIAQSPEYQSLMQNAKRHDDPGAPGRQALDDDIPF